MHPFPDMLKINTFSSNMLTFAKEKEKGTNLVIVSYSFPVLPMFLHSNEAYPPKKATSSTISACKRHTKVRVYPDTQPSSCIFVQLACSLCKTLTIQE